MATRNLQKNLDLVLSTQFGGILAMIWSQITTDKTNRFQKPAYSSMQYNSLMYFFPRVTLKVYLSVQESAFPTPSKAWLPGVSCNFLLTSVKAEHLLILHSTPFWIPHTNSTSPNLRGPGFKCSWVGEAGMVYSKGESDRRSSCGVTVKLQYWSWLWHRTPCPDQETALTPR